MKSFLFFVILFVPVFVPAQSINISVESKGKNGMKIESPDFKAGQMIPKRFSCEGEDVNPSLTISAVPENAKSLVLMVDDPDAPMGTWTHWVVWNISPDTKEIPINSVPKNAVQGKNSWGKSQWGGPCPPSGTHRYFFRLYAIDTMIDLTPDAGVKNLERVIKNHMLAKSELMGTYRKGK